MFLYLLITVTLVVAAFLFHASRQPDEFRVTRSAIINAPAEKLYGLVIDLHRWDEWSPWAKLDPNVVNTFSGPESGPGSSLHWKGNHKIGEGISTIAAAEPHHRVLVDLQFIKPMKAHNKAEFIFTPENGQTLVTWSMYGPNNFIGKIIGTLMNCERMLEKQFDEGLENLRRAATQ